MQALMLYYSHLYEQTYFTRIKTLYVYPQFYKLRNHLLMTSQSLRQWLRQVENEKWWGDGDGNNSGRGWTGMYVYGDGWGWIQNLWERMGMETNVRPRAALYSEMTNYVLSGTLKLYSLTHSPRWKSSWNMAEPRSQNNNKNQYLQCSLLNTIPSSYSEPWQQQFWESFTSG